MKTNLIYSVVAGSLVALSTFASAATTTTVNGGSISFIGEVVNAACAVDINSTNGMTVRLGQVRTAMLAQVGDVSGNTNFQIVLKDCDTTVSTKASVAFDGVATGSVGNVALDNVLALSGASSGASGMARNVGIQIFYGSDTTPLKIDGNQFSTPKDLVDGENSIPFVAKYYATGVATAGSANAVANFKVKYE